MAAEGAAEDSSSAGSSSRGNSNQVNSSLVSSNPGNSNRVSISNSATRSTRIGDKPGHQDNLERDSPERDSPGKHKVKARVRVKVSDRADAAVAEDVFVDAAEVAEARVEDRRKDRAQVPRRARRLLRLARRQLR